MRRILITGLVLGSLLIGCNPTNNQSLHPSGQSVTSVAAGPTLTLQVNETSIVDQAVPTLRIISPKDGETIVLPDEIHYQITGFGEEETPLVHIHAFVDDPSNTYQVEIPIQTLTGVAFLPDQKEAFLVGHRDLTFQLAYGDHSLVTNPEARVTIYNLTIEGRR